MGVRMDAIPLLAKGTLLKMTESPSVKTYMKLFCTNYLSTSRLKGSVFLFSTLSDIWADNFDMYHYVSWMNTYCEYPINNSYEATLNMSYVLSHQTFGK